MTNLAGIGFYSSGDLTIVEFTNASNSGSSTFTIPAAILAGDVMVFADHSWGSSNPPAAVVPAGFTSIADASSGSTNSRIIISYKIAVGTESGTVITGMTGAINSRKGMVVFRGSNQITSVVPSTWLSESTLSAPANQSVLATGQIAPLVVIGVYSTQGTAITVRGFTPASDADLVMTTALYFNYKIYNQGPLDTTISMVDNGINNMASGYLRLLAG